MPTDLEFESLVTRYYSDLYRFAFSLAHSVPDASDLTQQTFYLWASKGHQLRDATQAKSWLFTTLHREFLQGRRRQKRFPHHELEEVIEELPEIPAGNIDRLDANTMMELLGSLDERHRAPLLLYYVEDFSYQQIGEVLNIPLGTVQSRIARAKAQLYRLLQPKVEDHSPEPGGSHGSR
jgi:RNA polymerase sigma-70 factor (ECF subfamily)